MESSLSQAMRAGSLAEHRAAEGNRFVADILGARVRPAAYALYLGRLREVYAALESAVDQHRSHAVVGQIHDDRLRRLPAIDDDLVHWRRHLGPDSGSRTVDAYVARIRQAADWPELLVAHHYTRYLGDLSGGRLLARRLADGLGDGAALSFFHFPQISSPERYKRRYRTVLDALPLGDHQRRRIVREVRAAFRLSRGLLEELSGVSDH